LNNSDGLSSKDWESFTRIRWDKPGMKIVGRLIGIRQVKLANDRMAKEAAVSTYSGVVKFILPSNLERTLTPDLIECRVDIYYVMDVETKQGWPLKIFKVRSPKNDINMIG
jgi:hypothetical protein